VTRLVAHRRGAPPLDLELAAGEAAALPDTDEVIAWFVGGDGARRQRRRTDGDRLVIGGRDLAGRSPAVRVRAGLVVVGDPTLAPAVSVLDHLAAATTRARATALLDETPRLAGRGADLAGVLSGGERRLLGWARARMLAPEVVVLDRAGTGLDADALRWAAAQVQRWRDDGVVVLVRVGRSEEMGWAAG
jgi:ABC-type branched-subunit amino acid transport system ATPase component